MNFVTINVKTIYLNIFLKQMNKTKSPIRTINQNHKWNNLLLLVLSRFSIAQSCIRKAEKVQVCSTTLNKNYY